MNKQKTVMLQEVKEKEMIQRGINELLEGHDLNLETANGIMREIMSGTATDAQMAAYLTALRMKGETVEEITASAMVMRDYSQKVNTQIDALDIVGTGGDKAFTFNISTTSAFVIAAAGIPVAKHGNRSSSSKSGSADVLEALGIQIDLAALQSEKMLNEINMCFMFSQKYHPAMKYAAPVRKQIAARTIFNVLGPLANPANASMQMLGVYDTALVAPLAEVLKNLGVKKGLVFGGNDGLDEITLTTTSEVAEIRNGMIQHFVFDPTDYGFEYCQKEALTGDTPEVNAQMTLDILSGKKGPKRDTVLCNAGLAIYLAKEDVTIAEAIQLAGELIDNGSALAKLNEFKKMSNEVAV